jgi:hypothetical protein
MPIAVSFVAFEQGESCSLLTDPCWKEEKVASGRLTITLNAQNELCAIQKAGGVALAPADIIRYAKGLIRHDCCMLNTFDVAQPKLPQPRSLKFRKQLRWRSNQQTKPWSLRLGLVLLSRGIIKSFSNEDQLQSICQQKKKRPLPLMTFPTSAYLQVDCKMIKKGKKRHPLNMPNPFWRLLKCNSNCVLNSPNLRSDYNCSRLTQNASE